jgi:type I restriction enzyme S subunit
MNNLAQYPKYESYKNSLISSIGFIPSYWKLSKLKFCSNLNSNSLSENTSKTKAIEYVDIGNVSLEKGIEKTEKFSFSDAPSRARRLANEGDTIVSTVRTYLKAISFVDIKYKDCVFSTGFAIVEPNKLHIEPLFLANALKSNSFTQQVDNASSGISYPAINSTELSNIFIALPPIKEQKSISLVLDHKTAQIDQAIAIKQQQIALLKERKQILIQTAVTQGLNANAPMKDSGIEWIGQIPEHWEVMALNYAVSAVADVDHYMPPTVGLGVPYLMTGDLKELASEIDFDNCKKVSQSAYKSLTKKIKSEKGDVILARYATIGTASYIDIEQDFLVSYSCVTIKPDDLKLSGHYLFYFLKSDSFFQSIQGMVNTNTQGNVGIADLKKVNIALPRLEEQLKIEHYIESQSQKINQTIDLQQQQIEKLKEYKTTLINSAVTGKIKVC